MLKSTIKMNNKKKEKRGASELNKQRIELLEFL
jgi:hypothetical protein